MPLQDQRKVEVTSRRKFKVNDAVVLRLPKFVKDADDNTVYPQEVLKAFIKYFNQLYQGRVVFADRFIVDGDDKSHLDLFVWVPGELTRDDFLDDLADFIEDYPGVTAEIIKKYPNANEWNEKHKQEIASGAVKPKNEGLKMAKNSKSAYPKRTFKTLLAWVQEEPPVNPYPNAKEEELEELEAKKDPKLLKFYKDEDEYFEHQNEIKSLIQTFEQAYGTKFDKNDPDDIEGLELVYNDEYDKAIEEERKWYPADVRLRFPVGQFAPGKEGSVDLLSLYDSKKSTKDSKSVKDEEDPIYHMAFLLGKIHDAIMEAQEYCSDLEDEGKISSNLGYALDDLESDASDLDFMGDNDPAARLKEEFGEESDDYGSDEEEEW